MFLYWNRPKSVHILHRLVLQANKEELKPFSFLFFSSKKQCNNNHIYHVCISYLFVSQNSPSTWNGIYSVITCMHQSTVNVTYINAYVFVVLSDWYKIFLTVLCENVWIYWSVNRRNHWLFNRTSVYGDVTNTMIKIKNIKAMLKIVYKNNDEKKWENRNNVLHKILSVNRPKHFPFDAGNRSMHNIALNNRWINLWCFISITSGWSYTRHIVWF